MYQIETNLLSNALLMSKVHFPQLGTLISVILRLSTLSYREFSRRKRQVWKKKLHHVSKFTITYPWAKYEGFQFFSTMCHIFRCPLSQLRDTLLLLQIHKTIVVSKERDSDGDLKNWRLITIKILLGIYCNGLTEMFLINARWMFFIYLKISNKLLLHGPLRNPLWHIKLSLHTVIVVQVKREISFPR